MYGGHDVFALHHHRPTVKIAQGGVQHCAVLGLVDGNACEHLFAARLHACIAGERQQGVAGGRVNVGLGIIEIEIARLHGKVAGAGWIFEQIRDGAVRMCGVLRAERRPIGHVALQWMVAVGSTVWTGASASGNSEARKRASRFSVPVIRRCFVRALRNTGALRENRRVC